MASQPPQDRFTELYQAAYHRVLGFVRRRVGDPNEAEDLTAEVFKTAWARTCDGEPPSTGWLFVTARNLLRNHHRSQQRAAQRYRSAATELRTQQATHSSADAVRAALARLDEPHRSMLVLRYWDELTGREIAELLEASVPAVWVRLHRARRAFREVYHEGGDRDA